jgi:hypothetical protein
MKCAIVLDLLVYHAAVIWKHALIFDFTFTGIKGKHERFILPRELLLVLKSAYFFFFKLKNRFWSCDDVCSSVYAYHCLEFRVLLFLIRGASFSFVFRATGNGYLDKGKTQH